MKVNTLAASATLLSVLSSSVNALPTFPLPLKQWETIPSRTGDASNPGYDENNVFETGCGIDDEYNFLVRKGTVNKLLIVSMGGGICYDGITCFPGSILGFTEKSSSLTCQETQVGEDPLFSALSQDDSIFDFREEATNIFKEWNIVLPRLCTCDLGIGSKSAVLTDYGDCAFANIGCKKKTFNFRGGNNMAMILDFLGTTYQTAFGVDAPPTDILNTGCSAGGYQALLYSDHLHAVFPTSKITTLADSAMGSIENKRFRKAITTWGAAEGVGHADFAAILEGYTTDPDEVTPDGLFPALVSLAADRQPDTPILTFSYSKDRIQNVFKCITKRGRITTCANEFLSGRLMRDFRPDLINNAVKAQEGRCNVRTWFAPGRGHCAIIEGGALVLGARKGHWLDEDVGLDKPLYQLVVDAVERKCVESGTSDDKMKDTIIQTYCQEDSPCRVSGRAAPVVASKEPSDENTSGGNYDIAASIGGGALAGIVTGLTASALVLWQYGKKAQPSGNVVLEEFAVDNNHPYAPSLEMSKRQTP